MYTSPIASPISSPISSLTTSAFRAWEPRSKKAGQTLFCNHAFLMKWDWDTPRAWDGSHAGHTAEACTISSRQSPLAWMSANSWASQQAWAIVDSWGGVNAYCLSAPVPLHKLGDGQVDRLVGIMHRCHVDPFYIKNVLAGQQGHWQWCSRVWVKTWRPQELWTGRFREIWNPSNAGIKPALEAEFQKIMEMYNVFN